MNKFAGGSHFLKAFLLAVVAAALVIDDVAVGVTIVVRPSYRRIRIQGGTPSTTTTTTTTTTTARTTTQEPTTSSESSDEDEFISARIKASGDDEGAATEGDEERKETTNESIGDRLPSTTIPPSRPQLDELAEVDEDREDDGVETGPETDGQSPVTSSDEIRSETNSGEEDRADSTTERRIFPFGLSAAQEVTTEVDREEPGLIDGQDNALKDEDLPPKSPSTTTENVDESVVDESDSDDSLIEPSTTVAPESLADLDNELVGPGREAKAIESSFGGFLDNTAVRVNDDKNKDVAGGDGKADAEEEEDVAGGGIFGNVDPFLSVMGAMLSTSTSTMAPIPTTVSTTSIPTTPAQAVFPSSSTTEGDGIGVEQQTDGQQEGQSTTSSAAGPNPTESTSTENSEEISERPTLLISPATFLKESTLRNLEALLERDRQFREEQEQALSFLKTISTPLALSDHDAQQQLLQEVVMEQTSQSQPVDSTSFPPNDGHHLNEGELAIDEGGDTGTEEQDEDIQHPEHGHRRPSFFGGFRQFPPTLQAAGLSLPSQHQLPSPSPGRPLFAARPFPGPLPPTVNGFPGSSILPPNVPSNGNNNGRRRPTSAKLVVDPFLAASAASPSTSDGGDIGRQRSAVSVKRSPPPPILVFDSPRGSSGPGGQQTTNIIIPPSRRPSPTTTAALIAAAAGKDYRIITRPPPQRHHQFVHQLSQPSGNGGRVRTFRREPILVSTVDNGRGRQQQLPSTATAPSAEASVSDSILASASGGNPFLVRLPSDRGRAARRVVLQSHPDTEFVYTV